MIKSIGLIGLSEYKLLQEIQGGLKSSQPTNEEMEEELD